jgi:phosphatidylglycerol:prolipoprotein diacylglycerol transferase
MLPEIHIGPLTLQTFGICFALGFLASGAVISRRFRELGYLPERAWEAIGAALIGGLIGARLDYLIQNASEMEGGIIANLFTGSGLVWFGGLVGGAIAVILWARWRKCLGDDLMGAVAVALAIGYSIGRVGCQLSGDGDYGVAWDGPWAMAYPDGAVPIDTPVHPTPIYETLVMGLVALGLWHLRNAVSGKALLAIYLVCAGLERLLVELIRRNDVVLLGLTQAQVIACVMILGGAAWLLWLVRNDGAGPVPDSVRAAV